MSSSVHERFDRLGAELAAHEFRIRDGAFDRQVIGVGRAVLLSVLLEKKSVGVYARSASPQQLHIDFISDNRTVAMASYRTTNDGEITVGYNETPGLSIAAVARKLYGIKLDRDPYDVVESGLEQLVSDAELNFLERFVRHQDNSTAMFSFNSEPGQSVTGLVVSHLPVNLTIYP
ncbi:MAG: hypothetical protein ABI602_02100 [Candidatus Saccharibacteria bacterium]